MARLTLDGVPAGELAARWGVPQCGFFRSLASTLDAVHDLGRQGAPAGTVVVAEEQTAGRGRGGHTWHSPAGGMWLGALLRPASGAPGPVSLRVGLAVADAVDAVLGRPAAALKWPNDVMARNHKLGGILCEGRWQGDALQWLAIGVGVNVRNAIPAELRDRAIALAELAPAARRIDLLDRLVPALAALREGPLSDAECEEWAARDWLRGRQISAPLYGRAAGVRPDGALLVDTGGATAPVREGHVELA